jgi:hypothetical protein
MPETITTLDILNRLECKVQAIKSAIENKNVDRLRDECACSLICGDETILTEIPVLNEDFCFEYKGYKCELSSCNNITHISQIIGLKDTTEVHKRFPHGIFTDRYVCWIACTKDFDGKTLEEYLKDNPDETENNNYWVPELYLVPEAWAYGTELDLKAGSAVSKTILEGIDKFLEQHKDI